MIFSNYYSFSDSCYVKINTYNSDIMLWNIDDKYNPVDIQLSKISGGYLFPCIDFENKKFICFDYDSCKTPHFIGTVKNQNIKSLPCANYIIITHPDFEKQANRLAEFRQKTDNFSTLVVNAEQVYNEFSSGKIDPVAIRDFIKFLYTKWRSTKDSLIYLVLFGDGIIDCQLKHNADINYIPVYNSNNSGDNLYGVMTNTEYYISNEKMNIAVGRLPARTKLEAEVLVNKIIYSTADKDNWRNNITMIAGEIDYNNNMSLFKTVNYFADMTFENGQYYNINGSTTNLMGRY